MTNKIVINSSYGGFSLSMKALQLLAKKKGLGDYKFPYKWNYSGDEEKYIKCPLEDASFLSKIDYGDKFSGEGEDILYDWYDCCVARHDNDLIEVVEELGPDANGDCAHLEIVEISGNIYHIDEYDGAESIITPENMDWVTI